VVARGGKPGDSIARPMFLCVAEVRSIGAGLRRSSGELDIDGGGGEVGSSFTLTLVEIDAKEGTDCEFLSATEHDLSQGMSLTTV
jgi:hypothetical protein